jgi:[ribosomal protein S5]-alanine N-acetyltransferase
VEAIHPRLTLPLATPRLRLREFRECDFADEVARLESLYADARVTASLPFWPRTHAATVNRIRQVLKAQEARRRRIWELAVETRRGDFIGACGLVVVTSAADARRGAPRTAELGYVLAAGRWGHGYATELVQHLLRAAWVPLGLQRVEAIVAEGNAASVKVLERAGFIWEARLPGFTRVAGRRWDCELYVAASAPPAPRLPRGGRRG